MIPLPPLTRLTRILGPALLLLVSLDCFSQTRVNASTVPVFFDNVKISLKNDGVLVEWSNLTERELNSYVVEQSPDAHTYHAVTTLVPRSNMNVPESYAEFDAHPSEGLNYYRIRCNEISGRTIYSRILKIETIDKGKGLLLYPNPVTTGELSWSMSGLAVGEYHLQIVTGSGVPIYSRSLRIIARAVTETIDLPGYCPRGLYRFILAGESAKVSKAFVVL